MSTLLPPLNFRECATCFRDLSLGNYGIRRSNADSYNTECRECKNYWRRVSYYRRLERFGRPDPKGMARAIPHVFPLNEQNRRQLKSALSSPHDKPKRLKAMFIKSGLPLVVSVSHSTTGGKIVINSKDVPVTTYECVDRSLEDFVEVGVFILRDLRIRLL